ncbi:Protein CROWDED NUCLEI 1 [Quillaja saponaria]|uniref:Protein CROWDED NUCLEI 1 n=1 Tax=Quillaja saponaria TaxID=32244 RepID=A0AAD7PXV7_QUISA|nr:Protein CROWDED NUCLEI 1 [Quillaja saponaria]
MYTPKKGWSGWSLTPKSGAQKSGNGLGSNPTFGSIDPNSGDGTAVKGKGLAFVEAATPASGSIVENGAKMLVASGEAVMDREALVERSLKLEKELYEYQYNMGLLLIEKKESSSKYEELEQELVEAKDALKREKSAHFIAISEAEKREENLKKVLGVEKECVLDLEKALREMRSENAEIKFTADSKLAEANALVASVEEKSLEVEVKLHAADAKLAEISRKSSEIDRKSQDLEARESAVRRDRLSFIAERETHETTLSKQREDLREWERKLQEEKEKDLEEAQKKIDAAYITLKRKEDDISSRLANITLKEKECDAIRNNLGIKEEELQALEEKLNVRERVEIQKLLDEHNAILEAKKHEFEFEINEKRKSFEDELKHRLIEVEKKEAEIKHMEEKVAKREQAMENKTEKLREKEKDYDTKLKALKEKEKSISAEEKSLENEKKQLDCDREKLLNLKVEVEKIRASNEEELLRLHEETNRLKVTEEEKSECLRLQSELKQEIDQYRRQKELILKEADDLKQQKETFEREWEELDVKRAEIEKELTNVVAQKEELLKLKQSEEDKLKNEKRLTEDYVQRELEDLKLAKDSFAAQMEDEKSALSEKAQSERNQMLYDFEQLKRELQNDMQNQLEEKEKDLQQRRKLFEEERERELENINYLREVASREMEEMKLQRTKLEKEREEADENKKHLEKQRVDMQKDIDGLLDLSSKMKRRRQQFLKERECLISFVEDLKNCQNCGEMISDFVLSDIQFSTEIENVDVLPLPKLTEDFVKEGLDGNLAASLRQNSGTSPGISSRSPLSGGTMSWLRKCTSKIFKLSPGKKIDYEAVPGLTNVPAFDGEEAHLEEPSKRTQGNENEAELTFAIASDSHVQRAQSDNSIRQVEADQDQSADNESNFNSKVTEVPEDSQISDLKGRQRKPRKRGGVSRVKRTRSVKAVVEDAKAILGVSVDVDESEYQNGNAEDSGNVRAESQDQSSKRRPAKRNRVHTSQISVSEQDGDESEGRSDLPGKQKRKRPRAASSVQPPGEARYNLRRPRGGITAARASSDGSKEIEEEVDGVQFTGKEKLDSRARSSSQIGITSENGGSTQFVRCEQIADTQDGTVDLINNMAMSEEVNGTPDGKQEHKIAYEYRSEDDEDDDEECQHPGEVSIGKKLWTFLTT